MAATNGTRESPHVRESARVLLLDPLGRLLLLRLAFPDSETGLPVWFPPGGGVEPGESHEQAARREIIEETGLLDVPLGPWIWSRELIIQWAGSERRGEWFHAVERYYLADTLRTEITTAGWTDAERLDIAEYRWWTAAEVADAAREAVFVPRQLAALLPPVLAGELPDLPFRVE